jgi:phosphoribosylaminoimidazole-succinocarboxamide synthase
MTFDVPLPHLHAGKVRDLYDAGDGLLLLVASDRLSVFDVVLDEPVPDKGRVLTAISAFWFSELEDVAPNHLVSVEVDALPEAARLPGIAGRMMLVRRCEMLPVECIVRGHLAGTAWREYRQSGTVHGERMPAGLEEASPLPRAVFTPSTKAPSGEHDRNLTLRECEDLLGAERTAAVSKLCLAVFERAAARLEAVGLLLADTKLELGVVDGDLVIADELLTPDSSRIWDAETWRPGSTPASFDKQPVRDALEATGWDKRPPPPPVPDGVIAATRRRYVDACERITGRSLSSWPGAAVTAP